MSHAPFLFGAGGIILGFIGGIAIGSATSGSRINEAVADALAPGQQAAQQAASTQQEALAALSERIGALGDRGRLLCDAPDMHELLGAADFVLAGEPRQIQWRVAQREEQPHADAGP